MVSSSGDEAGFDCKKCHYASIVRLRKSRLAKGLCQNCGRFPHKHGTKWCQECNLATYRRRKENLQTKLPGICRKPYCNEPIAKTGRKGITVCIEHLIQYRAYRMEYLAKKSESVKNV